MRPSTGALNRRPATVRASQAAWGTSSRSSKPNQHPPLSYSINRRDIMGADLGMLLAACRAETMEAGPPLCRQNYSYWTSQAGLRHAAKLELALRRSVATVACFTTWDVYGNVGAAALTRTTTVGAATTGCSAASGAREGAVRGAEVAAEEVGLAELHVEEGGGRSQQPEPSSSSSSPSSSPSPSAPSHALGCSGGRRKPPTPPGVPDMDWNWLLPASGAGDAGEHCQCSSSNGGRSSWSSETNSSSNSNSSSSSSNSSNSNSGASRPALSLPFSSPSASSSSSSPPRKSLVGFARATGDNSLVATVYDVAVHPALRGRGIGGRLVKLLVQQVQTRAVYDIGVVTPAGAEGFWARCSFEDDREGSTFMIFTGRRCRGQQEVQQE
ncbi:hypothetical protein Agub_g15235, partial [Astrephomene gubernaculifera]